MTIIDDGVGTCAMYGRCGKKGFFGQELPCPDNDQPARRNTPSLQSKLDTICGPDFSKSDYSCCTEEQLDDLFQSIQQAEPLISSCPACRNNFVEFYCQFTCSSNQSHFVKVTSTQTVTNTDTGKPNQAVKSLDFWVNPNFGSAFFNSCKDLKFGATNGYVMDLIGGGAKSYIEFLRYMGQERPGLGSPFQIDFPTSKDKNQTDIIPLQPQKALRCDSPQLNQRCSCADCPSTCTSLPPAPPPFIGPESTCHIANLECTDFSLSSIYLIALVGSLIYIVSNEIKQTRPGLIRRSRRNRADSDSGYATPSGYERVSMHDPLIPNGSELSQDDENVSDDEEPSATANPSIGANITTQSSSSSSAPAAQSHPPAGVTATNTNSRSMPSLSPNSTSFISHQPRLGRGSLNSDPDPRLSGIHHQPRSYPLNVFFSRVFYVIGYGCASKPYLTMMIAFVICGLLNLGLSKFEVEKDPVNLWVAKGGQSAIEKADFDQRFGPFYRTEQIFLSSVNESLPVLNYERLKWLDSLERDIRSIQSPSGYTLRDVCLAPTAASQPPKSSSDCVVQSIMGYFGNSLDSVNEDNWADKLDGCATSPSSCLSSFGQPLSAKMVLGGIPNLNATEQHVNASQAKALIITFVVNNHLDLTLLNKAKEWENTLEGYLNEVSLGLGPESKRADSVGLKMDWSTEISLEGEINKSTNTDIPIVVLSYLAMFLYVAINLGGSGVAIISAIARGIASLFKFLTPRILRFRTNDPGTLAINRSTSLQHQLLVESKFTLALWSIVIVLLSVSTSVGLFSFFGFKITLIIAEVIPFLVLAIGVDNVFIIANEVSRQNSKAYSTLVRSGFLISEEDDEMDGLPTIEIRIAKAISRMGPSVLLSAACESIAFGLGAFVGMPAVRNFAIYAAGAVIINTILQMTVLVSVIAIDLHRMESNRIDCVPCVKLSTTTSVSDLATASAEGDLASIIRTIYAPFLMKRPVKIFVMCLFSGLFVLSIIGARKVELGLDQRLALPVESHLVEYFNSLDKYFDIGPPVYFVTKGIDFKYRKGQRELCGRFTTCDELSIANVLEAERKRSNVSFIEQPPTVWIDDFFQWLNPNLESCCRVKKANREVFCDEKDRDRDCIGCYKDHIPAWNITMKGLPEGEEFNKYLNHWLNSSTNEACPLGGKASYYNSIDNERISSNFRIYHTPLKKQSDYINAMVSARRISAEISDQIGAEVYPYSLFYVFFDQYSSIKKTTEEVISIGLLSIFIISSILLGSIKTGLMMILTILMIIMNVIGLMGFLGINLNGISLVNVLICVGISVEFCSHFLRSFIGAKSGGIMLFQHKNFKIERDERVCLALGEVGASVFTGIFSTKVIGIMVLGLTKSKLLELYYFKMWLILIISGGLHGLIFLPVLVSYKGEQGFQLDDDLDLAFLIWSRYDIERNYDDDDDDNDDDN